MTDALVPSLLETGALLAAAAAAGTAAGGAIFPPGVRFRAERSGWALALGLAALAAAEAVCLAAGIRPGAGSAAAALLALAGVGWVLRIRTEPNAAGPNANRETRWTPRDVLLMAAAAAGVLLYALRALTEPMWSNDFLAIWGLKGKAIFGAGAFPGWLLDPRLSGFSHPEYPVGLPLVFASLSAAMGRWDDHAMALLYPALQWASLAIVFGWLRRRGTGVSATLAAVALLSLFEPLYSAFLTGMAEVPVSAAMLLVGCALCDALDDADPGALRRLALASAFAAATKNEGLFFVAAACVAAIAVAVRSRRLRAFGLRSAAAALLPALALTAVRRAALGPAPLRDLDAGLLAPSRWTELGPRIGQSLAAAAELAAPAWPVLLAAAILFACGRRSAPGYRLLGPLLACAAAYVLIPALAKQGPEWLARASLPRTMAALAPLLCAALAVRYGGAGKTESAGRAAVAAVNPPDAKQVDQSRDRVADDGHPRVG